MPGIARLRLADAVAEARELFALGIKSVLLFGIPAHKDAVASSNYDPDGIVQHAIRAIKARLPEMLVIADLCTASTPITVTAASSTPAATSTTTRRSSCSRARR